MITFNEIKHNEDINTYIRKANESLIKLGFTEHSFAHVTKVCEDTAYILKTLGYDEHLINLAKIAGYMHDIGNVVNRVDHSQSGAIMTFRILDKLGMNAEDLSTVVTAVGNHDEGTGVAVSPLAAALILADKSDVRRSRVRKSDMSQFDIHDRVNYSVEKSELKINQEKTLIKLKLHIDTRISPVIDYLDIFMKRMKMCKNAAQTLGLDFKLIVNEQQLM